MSTQRLTQAAAAGAGGESAACGPLRPGMVLAASASRMDSENATAQRQIAGAADRSSTTTMAASSITPAAIVASTCGCCQPRLDSPDWSAAARGFRGQRGRLLVTGRPIRDRSLARRRDGGVCRPAGGALSRRSSEAAADRGDRCDQDGGEPEDRWRATLAAAQAARDTIHEVRAGRLPAVGAGLVDHRGQHRRRRRPALPQRPPIRLAATARRHDGLRHFRRAGRIDAAVAAIRCTAAGRTAALNAGG